MTITVVVTPTSGAQVEVSDPVNGRRTVTANVPSREVTAANVSIAAASAEGMGIGNIPGLSATNVKDAIAELAGENFKGTDQPSGSQVNEGDTWYDTDDNQLYLYRETSNGVFQWIPIMVGSAGGDSDTLDAGAFQG